MPAIANGTDYASTIAAAANANGVPPALLQSQLAVESGNFSPAVVFGTQRGGAGEIGIAQFLPSTAATVGVNPFDPIASIKAAAALMGSYLRQFNGDTAKALAAYNAGPGATQAAIAAGGSNWQAYIPASTRGYIATITAGGQGAAAPAPASGVTDAVGGAFGAVGTWLGGIGAGLAAPAQLAGSVEQYLWGPSGILNPQTVSRTFWRVGFTVAGVGMVGVGLALYFGGDDAIDAAKSTADNAVKAAPAAAA